MRMKRRSRCLPLVAACLLAHCVCAALEIPGADGSDGALRVTKESCVEGVYTIDLGQAATRLWDSTSPRSGKGVYDPEKWAVVFKYTSVQIDEGCMVKFVNHPSNPPVYWLVSGDVDIRGEINLDGDRGQDNGLDMDIGPAVCAKEVQKAGFFTVRAAAPVKAFMPVAVSAPMAAPCAPREVPPLMRASAAFGSACTVPDMSAPAISLPLVVCIS